MPSSSRFGSRDDTGVGVAPTFHAAIIAARNSTQLGSASTTMSPWPDAERRERLGGVARELLELGAA